MLELLLSRLGTLLLRRRRAVSAAAVGPRGFRGAFLGVPRGARVALRQRPVLLGASVFLRDVITVGVSLACQA